MLLSMGLQTVGYNLVTEQQHIFFMFFSIMVYCMILNIVPHAIE